MDRVAQQTAVLGMAKSQTWLGMWLTHTNLWALVFTIVPQPSHIYFSVYSCSCSLYLFPSCFFFFSLRNAQINVPISRFLWLPLSSWRWFSVCELAGWKSMDILSLLMLKPLLSDCPPEMVLDIPGLQYVFWRLTCLFSLASVASCTGSYWSDSWQCQVWKEPCLLTITTGDFSLCGLSVTLTQPTSVSVWPCS